MAGTALLLAFYSIMLWWRTQWQSSSAVAIQLLLAVDLLCAYELCAVYVTTGSRASDRYSPSGGTFALYSLICRHAGVVFGDVGTSPLYTFSVMFKKAPINENEDILGALSLVLYT
ncbi:hypothetical protein RYX36_010043 [Vicia faba]